RFLWPGYGENSRVLKWIIERIEGDAEAVDTPIGLVPTPASLDTTGLDTAQEDLAAALAVHPAEWHGEVGLIETWFATIGDRTPTALRDQLAVLRSRLGIG
ncbi:MAG TPA: phosphoenolpyruvate carboxykinase domain-containing protein, partial [Kineosporiaceae bacterium]|nr:phosphoenolpyruvate carboxykinase domain-containing protein [Kineosporiaceae bacterium]